MRQGHAHLRRLGFAVALLSALAVTASALAASAGAGTAGGGGDAVVRALRLLGRAHVVLVHFPIALAISAAALDGLWRFRALPSPSPATPIMVRIAVGASLAAAALGWVHARADGFDADPTGAVEAHRWIGTFAAAVGLVVAGLFERDRWAAAGSDGHGWAASIALFVWALAVGAAGHLGGVLTHGDGFWRW